MTHSKDRPVLNVDDDQLYEVHDNEGAREEEGGKEGMSDGGEHLKSTGGGKGAGNINSFYDRVIADSAQNEQEFSEDVRY